eukprot:6190852-Pleurochrysis_carterae.AAC.1
MLLVHEEGVEALSVSPRVRAPRRGVERAGRLARGTSQPATADDCALRPASTSKLDPRALLL